MKSLDQAVDDIPNAWLCHLYPLTFGSYFEGTKIKSGGYTVVVNNMTTVMGVGNTAGEAVASALRSLDKSYLKGLYVEVEKAFAENLDALQRRNRR